MKPVDFPEAQVIFAKDQPEYQPLPARVTETEVISCWEFTPAEICEIIRTKRIWLRQLHCGRKLQPQLPQVENPFDGTARTDGG